MMTTLRWRAETSAWLSALTSKVGPGAIVPTIQNSIHYCIELHSDLKWPDVKTSNATDPGRYARKAVRGGGARVRGTGNRRRQHRGDCGCGRLHARGILFEFQEQGRADHRHLSLIHISEPTRQAEISYA